MADACVGVIDSLGALAGIGRDESRPYECGVLALLGARNQSHPVAVANSAQRCLVTHDLDPMGV